MIRRCKLCILPENYPGIIFNDAGICQFCAGYREKQYAGVEALKEAIDMLLKNNDTARNSDYNCLLGFSGGRDSSFLLYYFAVVLNLKVLAFSIDNGFIPEPARQNMKKIADFVGAKLVIEKHDQYEKCIKHYMRAWMKKPSAAMIGVLCTGCKYNIVKRMRDYAQTNNIPLVVLGETPYEVAGHYKRNLMKTNPFAGSSSSIDGSFIAGYLAQIKKNPRWIMNPYSLLMQLKEYFFYFRKNIIGTGNFQILFPFMTHIRWEENKVMALLTEKLDWRKNSGLELNWRSDCGMAILKMYLYKKMLGFNDLDEGFSCLIRDSQISRETALARLQTEGYIDDKVIGEIVAKIGIDFSTFAGILKNIETPVIGSN